eukprot:2591107-Alexandrium_andersonii.AAC.1
MSASLVGSEMCIRDSFLACCGLSRPHMSSARCKAHSEERIVPSPERWTCLLYTSDAADDM